MPSRSQPSKQKKRRSSKSKKSRSRKTPSDRQSKSKKSTATTTITERRSETIYVPTLHTNTSTKLGSTASSSRKIEKVRKYLSVSSLDNSTKLWNVLADQWYETPYMPSQCANTTSGTVAGIPSAAASTDTVKKTETTATTRTKTVIKRSSNMHGLDTHCRRRRRSG